MAAEDTTALLHRQCTSVPHSYKPSSGLHQKPFAAPKLNRKSFNRLELDALGRTHHGTLGGLLGCSWDVSHVCTGGDRAPWQPGAYPTVPKANTGKHVKPHPTLELDSKATSKTP